MRVTPWFAGAAVAALVAVLAGVVLCVLFVAVVGVNTWLGLALLTLGTAGAAPVLVEYRRRPVARWFCLGLTVAILAAWAATGIAIAHGYAG